MPRAEDGDRRRPGGQGSLVGGRVDAERQTRHDTAAGRSQLDRKLVREPDSVAGCRPGSHDRHAGPAQAVEDPRTPEALSDRAETSLAANRLVRPAPVEDRFLHPLAFTTPGGIDKARGNSGAPTEVAEVAAEAYCVKCKAKREIKDAVQITMKNGRPATEGKCPVCGTKMFKIGSAA
jgi:hypothetical protein